jgi:hypothetical protein
MLIKKRTRFITIDEARRGDPGPKRRMTGDVAFLLRMPAGIPGEATRGFGNLVVEPNVITPSNLASAPTAYGQVVAVDGYAGTTVQNTAGMIRSVVTAVDTAVIQGIFPYGILIRPFPTQSSSWPSDTFGGGTPPAAGACDVGRAGYCSVLLSGTAAATKGGQVFIWFAAASGSHILGGIEAAATGGSTLIWPNATFTGAADPNGNTEISFNL